MSEDNSHVHLDLPGVDIDPEGRFDALGIAPNPMSGPQRVEPFAPLGTSADLACSTPDEYEESILSQTDQFPTRDERRDHIMRFVQSREASATARTS